MSGLIGNSGQKSGLVGGDNVYFTAFDEGQFAITHNTKTLVNSYDVIEDSHGGLSGGRYTIPVSGTWQFHISSEFYSPQNNISYIELYIYKDAADMGSNYAYNREFNVMYNDSSSFNSGDGIRYNSGSHSLCITATAGTIYDFRAKLYVSGTSTNIQCNGATFSGYRLGV